MNDHTNAIMADYKPHLAIVVYKTAEKDYYLESHHMDEEGNIYEGKPLLQETIQDIVNCFYTDSIANSEISGLMPPNLLQFGKVGSDNYKIVWYTPAGKRFLHFSEALKIPSGMAEVPAMVYVADKKKLDVYALDTDQQRPIESSLLYYAPFYNVNSVGAVCLGSAKAKLEERTYSGLIKFWETIFWNSVFTQLHGANPTKTNVTMLWQRLLNDQQLTWAQLDELLPNKRTLKNLLK